MLGSIRYRDDMGLRDMRKLAHTLTSVDMAMGDGAGVERDACSPLHRVACGMGGRAGGERATSGRAG